MDHIMIYESNQANRKIWFGEFELRQFVYLATKLEIEAVYNTVNEVNLFGVFVSFISSGEINLQHFKNQLLKKCRKEKDKREIESDLGLNYYPMIDLYSKWYESNLPELEKFEPYSPYKMMYDVIENTKKEILKYFPDIEEIAKLSNY